MSHLHLDTPILGTTRSGGVVGNGIRITVALGGDPIGRNTLPLQPRRNGLGTALRQPLVSARGPVGDAVGIAVDLNPRVGVQRITQDISEMSCRILQCR